MSTAKRAYDMLRGYVNREWDRIQGLELSDAERELADSLDTVGGVPSGKATTSTEASSSSGGLDQATARKILGVPEGADFGEIRKAFDRIIQRTDPGNFPAGSPEADQAASIHRRVHRAYAVLTDGMDATEKRFRTLEID